MILSGAAGQPSGEPPQSTSLTRVLEDVKARLASGDRDRVRIADAPDAEVQWPVRPVGRALANVIQNALQASGSRRPDHGDTIARHTDHRRCGRRTGDDAGAGRTCG